MKKCLDLFSGTRSIANAFEKAGWEVYTVEIDKRHERIDWYADIMNVTAQDIIERFGHPDVIWASPPCFVGDTLVLTKQGFKQIKDIKIGDEVLTHKNQFQKVTNIGRKQVNKTRTIKVSCSIPIETTDNHPFFVRTKERVYNSKKRGWDRVYGEPMWLKAEDLDKTKHMVGFAINQKEELPQWDGVEKTIRNQTIVKTYNENNLSRYFTNENFWWLIGRYIGDGWIRNKPLRYEFIICCANDEVTEITSKLNQLGSWFRYRVVKEKTVSKIILSKKELVKFVSQFGIYAYGKRLTGDVINLPIYLLKSFLDGYFSADGCELKKGNAKILSCCSVSRELIQGIAECVVKVYKKPVSINIHHKGNTQDIIQGRTVNVRDIYILQMYIESKKCYSFVEDNILWTNIKKISEMQEETYVYNLTVNKDNSYTANGVIVHNCEKFSVAAIGHYWNKGSTTPANEEAQKALDLLQHTINLIKELNPTYYYIENPRGMMRKMECMQSLPRYTVTYCQYGDRRQKPTDIWTNHPDPKFKPPCHPGDPCHEAAPRGSRTGTQGIKGAVERSRIPEALCNHIVEISIPF